MRKRYRVEIDDEGCPHCGSDRTWTVVDPLGVAASQSWGDSEEAEAFAEDMNRAFKLGQQTRVRLSDHKRHVPDETLDGSKPAQESREDGE
jgi:hypothetical protein